MPTMKKSKNNSNDKATLAVFAVLIIVTIVPLFTFYIYPAMTDSGRQNTQVSIPRISSPVISSKDGSSHDVDITIVVEVNRKAARNMDVKELHEYAVNAVANMDFEKIDSGGSTDYIKSELNKELVQHIGEKNLKGIYLMDVYCDQVDLAEQGPSEQEQRRNSVLKALFPKTGQ